MNNFKNDTFDILMRDMGNCEKCLHIKSKTGKDCSLINIFNDINFSKNIPSIWTDWYNRIESSILIIGQDWGPYKDMVNLNKNYLKCKNKENWKRMIEEEKSLTKKQLTKYLIESSKGIIESLDDIYITNAIMCARQGQSYRGDNINLKKSTMNCSEFLYRQIEIVKPKVILTLGYYPLLSLSDIFGFNIDNTLEKCIANNPIIEINKYVIIPLYHPVAQIKKEKQLEQYSRIWNYVK